MKKRQKEKDSTLAGKSPFGIKSNYIIQQNDENCNQKEMWVGIKGLESKYQISNLGRVRKIHILTPRVSKKGYQQVTLEKCHYYIHRLVAIHFLEPLEGKFEVNHLDGNPSNNNVNNLEWCTHQENVQYSFDKLGRKHKGIKGAENVSSKAVCQFDSNGNLIKIWGSQMEVERELGIRHSNISNACRGITKDNKSHGFIWKWLI